ncbi:MAG TPA: hypothetical protein VFR85_10505 [Anaeromyxobacteraceae bacterium]|nr:hypothetical protein [Anaeromyxobacteraceae bacterium]
MIPAAALAALALAADASLPYPAPRLLVPTERTKCDTGTVLAADGQKGVLRITTPAGVVTYKAGPETQVFEKDGKPAGGIARLQPNEKVRVYYVVEDGARAGEVDLE